MSVSDDLPDLGLADLAGVVRPALIFGHLDKFIDVMDEADRIFAGLPKETREELECRECGQDTNLSVRAKAQLAMSFAQLGPDVRTNVRTMLEQVRQYVCNWTGEESPEDGDLYGLLDTNDMKVIEEMIGFVQKVGTKSVRHLLTFLESSNEGEPSFLLIQAANRQSEIRHRYDVSPVVKDQFGLPTE
jgi:hypothetical protein